MPELARSLVAMMRQFVGDRRHTKRRKTRLAFSLSLASPAKGLNGTRRLITMQGHTLDLSESGVALIVPAITLGEHHLVGENRSLNVRLDLPTGPIELHVSPVRYESLEEHKSETGYLIGAKIVGVPDEDRARFSEYVASLMEGKR